MNWSPRSENDLYYYVKEFFRHVLGYPVDHVVINEPGTSGIPDVSLAPKDTKSRDDVFWVVGEIKRTPLYFREHSVRKERWKSQLSRYTTPDSVYALLIDPVTIAILRPDGEELNVIHLDEATLRTLLNPTSPDSLAKIAYDESVSEVSLKSFKEGTAPSRYIDASTSEDREKFYRALRLSARELIDFSIGRLKPLAEDYEFYNRELLALTEKALDQKDEAFKTVKRGLAEKHFESVRFFKEVLPGFEAQIGKQLPRKEGEARQFLNNLYATEGSSLVLARILFIRFFEDHGMTTRKISNGGIKRFRDFFEDVKEDYRFLLTSAYKDVERKYRRLFEPSIFDWSHEGDGQLSRLLLRIFYRLNAFDFTKITGDILGNLYERFLEPDKRKRLGEYYTPMNVAKYVLERIGFFENPGALLDPSCGSGTFLIAALEGTIERLRKKGVSLDVAIKQAVSLVHGLDINMFAAFIAQLQMIWHLFPFLKEAGIKEIPELTIHGGVNSLVYSHQPTLTSALIGPTAEESMRTRDAKYKYVVGNPPYIRNERLKDRGPWRELYGHVDFRNSDIAFFFVARAIEGGERPHNKSGSTIKLPSWLEEGGRMCFVLPMGICDSDAASPLRERLLRYKFLEVTDLEDIAYHIFPSPQASTRATVAPVLIFVERAKPNESNPVIIVRVLEDAVTTASIDLSKADTSQVPQELFHHNQANPYGQILTKLRTDDLPLLRLLMSNPHLKDFVIQPTPTYGIKVGGDTRRLSKVAGQGLLPLAKGQNISTFYANPQVTSWVDPNNVESRSIWTRDEVKELDAYAVSEIALAPQCSSFNPSALAFNNTAVLFLPRPEVAEFPWDALINSSLIRFVHLLTLGTALVGVGTPISHNRRAAWRHLYPRTLEALPVPKNLVENPRDLSMAAEQLRRLASTIARRWDVIEESMSRATKRSVALWGVDFRNWHSEADAADIRMVRENGYAIISVHIDGQEQPDYLRGPYDVLNVLKFLLDRMEGPIGPKDLQALEIPANASEISKLIDKARDPTSSEIEEFRRVQARTDEVIGSAFGLSPSQLAYIRSRLSSPPLDVLQPRWPWTGAEMRKIQEYEVDRFA